MRFSRLLAGTVVAGVIFGAAPSAGAEQPGGDEDVQLVVKARPAAAAAAIGALEERVLVEGERRLPGTHLTTLTVPAADADQALRRLNDDTAVDYAELDVELQAAATPSDPEYWRQWAPPKTGVDAIWDTTTGHASVVIAVVDSGVNQSHPDFAGASFVPGRNYVTGGDPGNTSDDLGHGTSVAGIIGAQHNSTGIAGVCPRCTIMPLKSLSSTGAGNASWTAAAIDFAVTNGADIINLSLSGTSDNATLKKAVEDAVAAGVLVVGAAGNAHTNSSNEQVPASDIPRFPGSYPGVVGVAASDSSDGRDSYSNYGEWVDLAAPGCQYTLVGGSYGSRCGTSFSTPLVAGIAGLLASTSAAPNAATLARVLQGSAVPVSYVAEGRVAGAAALTALSDTAAPSVGLTAPAGGWVRGSVEMTANATDNRAVKRVEFLVGGTRVATSTSAPYRAAIDTAQLGDGAKVLSARAMDTAGLTTTSAGVNVGVDNAAPVVAITAPSEGQSVSGSTTLSADVTDVSPLQVTFAVDGTTVGVDTTAPYSASLDTTALTPGTKTLTVTALDSVGLSSSAARSFTVAAPVTGGGGGGGGGGAPAPATSPTPTPSPSATPTPAPDGDFTEPVTAEAAAGGTLRTDVAGAAASTERPLLVSVTTPIAGTISIRRTVEPTASAPRDYRLLGVESIIEAPQASPTAPLLLEFRILGSALDGHSRDGLHVLRNGQLVLPCTGAGATPDPCVAAVAAAGADIVLSVRTSRASTWSFALATAACPGGAGPVPFSDVAASSIHAPAISCAAALDVARGVDPSRFGPAASVNRAQMATFVVNALSAAGFELPPGRDAFTDDDGNAHEAAINRLAAAGIVGGVTAQRYAPAAKVTREQMATFLVRAYEHMAGAPLPAGGDAFSDDDRSAHQASINTAAAAGLASGVAISRFDPSGAVRRDQMATFLVRALDKAVADGVARR